MRGGAGRRYNAFAFPSDTDFRFGLLIAVVLGSSLLMYQAITNTIASGGETQQALNDRCSARAQAAHPGSSFSERQSWVTVFNACENAARGSHLGALAGVALVVGGAVALYVLHPAWKRRRGRLVPLTVDDASEVLAELHMLTRVSGLRRPPAFMWNPLNMAKGGVAFGTPNRRVVALSGGLTTMLWTDPDSFRAIVLHELAHLRNGDVDKAYLTVAVWWSFVVTAMLPFALLTPGPGGADLPRRLLSLVSLALVVYLLRNATLRSREMFADVRASGWKGYADALDRVLPGGEAPRPRGWRGIAPRAKASMRLHPSAASRHQAVRDTTPLFRVGWLVALGVGFAGSVSLLNVAALVNDEIAALGFAALVTGVVGLAVWRATFLAEAEGARVHGLTSTALALGAGFAAGDALSLSATATPPPGFALWGVALLLFDLVWYGLLFLGIAVFLQWLAATASTWLPAVAERRSPRLAYLLGIPLAVPVLAVGLWLLLTLEPFRATGGQLPTSALAQGLNSVGVGVPDGPYLYAAVALAILVLELATKPALLAVAQLLWLVPLAPWVWRRRMADVASARWALMEGEAPAGTGAAPPDLRLGSSVVSGLIGGLAFWLLSLLVVLVLSTTYRDGLQVWIVGGQQALGMFVQVVVAALVAYRARALGAVLGIFAGFVCGLVATAAALMGTAIAAGPEALRIQGIVSSIVIAFTAVAVLGTIPAASAAALLASWVRRDARPAPVEPGVQQTRGRPHPLLSPKTVYPLVVLGGAVLILTVSMVALGGIGAPWAAGSGQADARLYKSVVATDILALNDVQKNLAPKCRSGGATACRQVLVAMVSSLDTANQDLARLSAPTCLAQPDRDIHEGLALESAGARMAIQGIDQDDQGAFNSGARMLAQGASYLKKAAPELSQATC